MGIEAKVFGEDDINHVGAWMYRANEILEGKHVFTTDWASSVIENLRPYVSEGNVVHMCVTAMERMYKKKTGRKYVPPKHEPREGFSGYDLAADPQCGQL